MDHFLPRGLVNLWIQAQSDSGFYYKYVAKLPLNMLQNSLFQDK